MDMYNLSFIIPVYNPPIEYFRECIYSIAEQSCRQYELIVVDDGSDGAIADEIDGIIQGVSDSKVLHLSHAGVSNARNKGIEIATGKYIMFVDADDRVDADFANNAMSLADRYDADIVFGVVKKGKSKRAISDGSYLIYEKESLWKVQEGLLCPECKVPPMKGFIDHGQCGKLFRRKAIDKIRFPEDVNICEDQVFVHSVLKNSMRCIVYDSFAYYYRQNMDSVTHSYFLGAIDVMDYAMELLQGCILDNEKLKEAFNYRVVDEMRVAFAIEYLNGPGCYQNFRGGVDAARKIVRLPLMDHALENLHLCNYKLKFSAQAWLLKNGHLHTYVILKWIMKLRVFFRNRLVS